MIIKVNDEITLEVLNKKHAAEAFALIDTNRIHLREWLPWVDYMKSQEDFDNYIANCEKLYNEGLDFGCVIFYKDKIAGRIGIHHINHQNKAGAIGYWLGESFAGKGIITKSCETLIKFGFTELHLNRIEIKCGAGNEKSRAVAERLQFKLEGILRQAEKVNGKFIDLFLFSLLKEEWERK